MEEGKQVTTNACAGIAGTDRSGRLHQLIDGKAGRFEGAMRGGDVKVRLDENISAQALACVLEIFRQC